ncbi:MAG: HAD-IIIA family hydrolase [Bacteroidota bacterium]|nr:HAD-IIIA family hydrolase [Bacteroidota bacterium]
MGKNYKADLHKITTFVFDYDGVLTDGKILLTSDGDTLRTGNVKDGYALQLAVKNNYNVVIISGGYSMSTQKRLESLGVKHIFLGVDDKLSVYETFMKEHKISDEQVLYMGDDIPDYNCMKKVGTACCPSDATEEIKNICDYISHKEGGMGCVRDVIEQVLKVQDNWMNHTAHNW